MAADTAAGVALSGSLVLASGGRSRGARPGLPLGAVFEAWHAAQQPGTRGHSLRWCPVPTSRATRRHLLHSGDEDAGAGTTGGPGPREATGAPGGTRVLPRPRWGLHGTLAGWGGSVSRAFGPGSANCSPESGAQVKSWAGLARRVLTPPGQGKDGCGLAHCCRDFGAGDSGPWGAHRLRAGGGRPGCLQDLDSWPRGSTRPGATPMPVPSGQEAPLAREEVHLAPASDTLSRRGGAEWTRA